MLVISVVLGPLLLLFALITPMIFHIFMASNLFLPLGLYIPAFLLGVLPMIFQIVHVVSRLKYPFTWHSMRSYLVTLFKNAKCRHTHTYSNPSPHTNFPTDSSLFHKLNHFIIFLPLFIFIYFILISHTHAFAPLYTPEVLPRPCHL